MITLSNGHSFEFVAASGALAYDGRGWPWEWPLRWAGLIDPNLFTIVTKSLTLKPRVGNLRLTSPWRCVKLLDGGVVNAVGLTNPGVDWWVREVYPQVAARPWPVAVSIVGEQLQDFVELAIKLKSCEKIKALEINASCPNTPSDRHQNTQVVIDTVRAVKSVTRWPLLLKLSCTHDYKAIAQALEGTAEAISINSVPWKVLFPKEKSPLANLGGGGVSGRIAQKEHFKMVEQLASTSTVPVIGAGVWEYEDMEKLFKLGAGAVAFGSIFVRYPWRPTDFVKRYRKKRAANAI